MTQAMLAVVSVLAGITVATCLLLVVLEVVQGMTAKAVAERRLLEVKRELRRLRADLNAK